MTNLSRTARALVAASVLTFAAPAFAAGPPAPAAGTPNPKILVIDRAAILRGSVVGQNIMKQVQALTVAAEQGLKARDAALRYRSWRASAPT